MKIRTVLVPLTMPLVLAACLGGGGGGGGSGWRNFTSFDNINPNQRVQFQSGGGSVNYAADVVGDDISRDGEISNEGARLRVRFGDEDPITQEIAVDSLELTVNLPDGSESGTFDGQNIADVGAGPAADRFIVAETTVPGANQGDPDIVTDRLYVDDNEVLALEYMTFGLWELGLDQAAVDIGGAAFGALTPATGTDSMPTTGTASYDGDLIGYNVLADSTTIYVADSQIDADFDTAEVTFSSTNTTDLAGAANPGFDLLPTTGTIDGNTFSGDGLTIAGLAGQAGDPDSGSFGGAFFGPSAAEAGGWFEMRNISQPEGTQDRYFGSFGAAETPIP